MFPDSQSESAKGFVQDQNSRLLDIRKEGEHHGLSASSL